MSGTETALFRGKLRGGVRNSSLGFLISWDYSPASFWGVPGYWERGALWNRKWSPRWFPSKMLTAQPREDRGPKGLLGREAK